MNDRPSILVISVNYTFFFYQFFPDFYQYNLKGNVSLYTPCSNCFI